MKHYYNLLFLPGLSFFYNGSALARRIEVEEEEEEKDDLEEIEENNLARNFAVLGVSVVGGGFVLFFAIKNKNLFRKSGRNKTLHPKVQKPLVKVIQPSESKEDNDITHQPKPFKGFSKDEVNNIDSQEEVKEDI